MWQLVEKGLLELDINGDKRTVIARPADTLHVLRTQLGLTGAKPGCENGDCGACTVIMDGWPIKSCLTLAVESCSGLYLSRVFKSRGVVSAKSK